MDWIPLLCFCLALLGLVFVNSILLFVVGHNYALLYDLGIKAGLISDDEEDKKEDKNQDE